VSTIATVIIDYYFLLQRPQRHTALKLLTMSCNCYYQNNSYDRFVTMIIANELKFGNFFIITTEKAIATRQ